MHCDEGPGHQTLKVRNRLDLAEVVRVVQAAGDAWLSLVTVQLRASCMVYCAALHAIQPA